MLREWRFERTTEPEEVHKAELKQRRADLAGLQQRLKQAGLPVIVLVEGWGAAGKGSVIRSPDPGAGPPVFKVISVSMPTEGGTPLALPEALRSEHPGGGKGPLPGLGMDG